MPRTNDENEHANDEIDFVVLWVDGNDPAWRAKKARFEPPEDPTSQINGEQRFRDWGLMKYWFRGVEKFAPWVRKVHFVSDDQYPDWLDRNAPKLACVPHRCFIPEQRLPLFNSCAIEMHLHRIPGLAEHFVEFNDDMFLGRPICPKDLFPNGKPISCVRLSALGTIYPRQVYAHRLMNEAAVVNAHHDWRKTVFRNPRLFLSVRLNGFSSVLANAMVSCLLACPSIKDVHLPYCLSKSSLLDAWNAEPAVLGETAAHRFRNLADVSARVFRDWQIASCSFSPRRSDAIGQRYYATPNGVERLCNAITSKKHIFVCANDEEALSSNDYEMVRRKITAAFETILPEKSSFEI